MKDIIAMEEMDLTRDGDGYEELLASIRREFQKCVKDGTEPLFTTNAGGLYDLLLQKLPEGARQHYNCYACRHFVNRYGGLVKIDEKTGKQTSAMWNEKVPPFFADAVKEIRKRVNNADVTGVFVTSEKTLGTPVTGSWTHMAVEVPKNMVFSHRLKSAYQESSEKAEDYRLLKDAVYRYRVETVEEAVNLLRSNSLYRGEKVLGVAEWFLEVLRATKGKRNKGNMLWRKAATAPAGFCHVSTSMIGTLLDDIEAGYSMETVSRKFAEKMDPLKYQRPQAAPTAGNVAQAEKIVEKLGIERSLKRRFARLDELVTVWRPKSDGGVVTGGVFAGIKTKQSAPVRMGGMEPSSTMTWEKFRATVLPKAKKIEYYVPPKEDNYSAILTAQEQDAPPIIRWDTEEHRCPFNWYVYRGGSRPAHWGLTAGSYVEVTGITLQPNMWYPGFEHEGKSVFFILKNCKDHRYGGAGIALVPEVLKGELREIRSTIEAYSRNETLGGFEEASACGIRLQGNAKWWDYKFRVTTDVGTAIYTLDRWD